MTLTAEEFTLADFLASRRDGRGRNSTPLAGQASAATARDNQTGWRGELTIAKALDLYPRGICTWTEERANGGADLSHNIAARARSRPDGGLIVRPQDPAGWRYVLARPDASGQWVAVGWMYGAEAKRLEWLKAPGGRPPAYFPPDEYLRPMAELAHLIARERYVAT